MTDCEFKGEKYCKKISTKLNTKCFWGPKITIGKITDISRNCMCIKTIYYIPLTSMIHLYLRFKRKKLYIPVKVNSSSNNKSHNDTMSVEVLNQSEEYTDFVGSFGSMSEAQKIC
jgi:hypothetical protein